MPIIKSAKKRVKVTEKRTALNRKYKDEYKTAIRDFKEIIDEGNVEKAEAQLKETIKVVDKAVGKGIIHKNKANRKKSQFTKMVNEIK